MFVDYFYYLKERLPVSVTEYLSLIDALDKGLIHNIIEFYYTSRSLLCKNEHHFDIYDIAFANFFKHANMDFPEEIKEEIWDWLNKDITVQELITGLQQLLKQYGQYIDAEELERFLEELMKNKDASFGEMPLMNAPGEIKEEIWEWIQKNLDLSEVNAAFQQMLDQIFDIKELQKRFEDLMERQTEEHNGGNQWIGTQGQSQFGNNGQNPMGMKVGGVGGMRSAVQIAEKRIFKDYRKDVVLDTRQIKIALKRLKKLEEIGKLDELNMDKTIDLTAKNGGDIEIVFEKKRKNNVKLLLLMDVGGSMTPYAHLVNLLFSAANNMSHWKDFKYYYFHNCMYERVFLNANCNWDEAMEFDDFLTKYDKSYRVVCVGDAAMARFELTDKYGSYYYYDRNELPGIYYIRELNEHFKKNIVWLNPELYASAWTRKAIASIIPMFDLTVGGIEKAMDYLKRTVKSMYTSVDRLKDFKF